MESGGGNHHYRQASYLSYADDIQHSVRHHVSRNNNSNDKKTIISGLLK